MAGSSKSIEDSDSVAKLMPNVAKLIRADTGSSESNGSTSVSLFGISGNDRIQAQNTRRSRQRPAEGVLRDVANKFFRRRATVARSIGPACAPSTLDMLSSYHRVASSSPNRRNVYMFEKENVRPKVSTLVKQGTLPIIQQNMAMRNTSQKAAWELRRYPTRSVVKLARQRWTANPKSQPGTDKSNTDKVPVNLAKHVTPPKALHSSQGSEEGSCYVPNLAAKSRRGKAKLFAMTTPIGLSELQEKFAELDGEALEEEEVSIAHLTTIRPVLASETELQHADISDNVVENRKDLSRCGGEDEVSATLNPNLEEAAGPNCSHGQGREGIGICTSQSKLSKTPGRDQDVQVSEPRCRGTARCDPAASSGTNCNAVTRPERQLSPSGCRNLHDGDELDNVECRNEERPPRFQDSSSPSVNGTEDKARTSDMETSLIPLDASAQEFSGKGRSVCAEFELEHAEGSCNDRRGYLSLKPNEGNFKEMTADGADARASHREDTTFGHTPTLREDKQSAPSKAEGRLEQEGAPDGLQEGACPTRDSSATPARNAILLTCLHYSRRGRSTDMSQRRLVFVSSSESLSRQKVGNRSSDDDSVSTVEYKGITNPPTDVLNPDAHEYDASMNSVPHQEATVPFIDIEVIDHGDEGICTSPSSKPNAATHYQDVVEREPHITGSLEQDDKLPDFEASRGVVGTDPGIYSLGGPATEVPKARGLRKRTWASLGDPIVACENSNGNILKIHSSSFSGHPTTDGGTEWKKGRRVSTRIKSRPLDWWRGEKMLYGRVHSTLCTLIGIKTTSPDPIWPGPKPQRGDYNIRNFHVDSYVGDSHRDLLRLAAQ